MYKNNNRETKEDPLDRLLDEAPLAAPTPWFESRVLARVKGENQPKFFLSILSISLFRWLKVAAPVCAVLLLLLVFRFSSNDHQESVSFVDAMTQEEIFIALEVFESYSEEVDIWGDLL